jgi:hypothetical protein
LQLGLQPIEIRIEQIALRAIGDEQPVLRAVPGLQQIRRRHVVKVDEEPRPDREHPLATSGSCWTIAPTLSVASPTAIAPPIATPSRAASRASGQASPRAGIPVARVPSGAFAATSTIAPRSG